MSFVCGQTWGKLSFMIYYSYFTFGCQLKFGFPTTDSNKTINQKPETVDRVAQAVRAPA
jgi:hypothetical protein